MRSKKKKNIMIIVLCFVLLLMGVGYAALSQRLTIGGTAKMQGVWDVRITNIQLSRKTGLAKDNSHKYENLSASFQTETLAPGDMLEYTVSVSNRGNIDAKVSEINATLDGPEAIKYTVEGIKKGDIIKEGVTKEVIITIKFDENATVIPSNKTSTLNINFTCIQNTQNVPTENLTVYKTRMKKAENSPSETTNFFDGPIARNKIKKITFYDTLNVEGYSNNFDISEDSSGKVLAWYKTDSTGYYELAIGQDGGVIANPNMSFYFAKMSVLEEINLEKLDTFGVAEMQNMFENCKNLKELDLSSFDTKRVYNMANMFLNCSSVKSINLKSFRTPSLTLIPNMFSGCSSLVELDLTNLVTLKDDNSLQFNIEGYYKITFVISAYVPKAGATFNPKTDFVSVGFRLADTDNIYIGASKWINNETATQIVGHGIIAVENTSNLYELINLSNRTIYLNSPDIKDIGSESYFTNSFITVIIDYLGRQGF